MFDDENPKRVPLEAANDPPVSHTQSVTPRLALHQAKLRLRLRMGSELLELVCDPSHYRIVEPIKVPLGSGVKLDVHSFEPALAKIFFQRDGVLRVRGRFEPLFQLEIADHQLVLNCID